MSHRNFRFDYVKDTVANKNHFTSLADGRFGSVKVGLDTFRWRGRSVFVLASIVVDSILIEVQWLLLDKK